MSFVYEIKLQYGILFSVYVRILLICAVCMKINREMECELGFVECSNHEMILSLCLEVEH